MSKPTSTGFDAPATTTKTVFASLSTAGTLPSVEPAGRVPTHTMPYVLASYAVSVPLRCTKTSPPATIACAVGAEFVTVEGTSMGTALFDNPSARLTP